MKPLAKRDISAMAAAEPVLTREDFNGLPPTFSLADCVGECMMPFIPDGSKLVFSRVEKIEAGDVASIWWAPGMNAAGSFQVQVKQILVPKAKDGTFVYRLFQPYTVRGGRRSDVMGLIKCIGFKRDDGRVREVDFAKLIAPVRFVSSS